MLRLFPKPASTMVALYAADSYDAVLTLIAAARPRPRAAAVGLRGDVARLLEHDRDQRARRAQPADDVREYGAYALIEALDTDPAIDAPRFQALAREAARGRVPNAVVAQSVADQKAFWNLRDSGGELHQLWPRHMVFDIGLPVAAMDEYARRCKASLAERVPGCESVFYGHIGDGNVHIVIYQPGACKQPEDEVEEVVCGLGREYGGTVSAEHGIDTLKLRWLSHARSPEQVALMKTLKAALDPKNVLNPGKVV